MGTTGAVYYCMKYLTKTPPDVDCVEALALLYFDRSKETEDEHKREGMPLSSKHCGPARFKSLALGMSKMQHILTMMWALYLRRHSCLFSSHDFVTFHLAQTMVILEHQDFEAVLVSNQEGNMIQATQLRDYMYRPAWMSEQSMIAFVTSDVRVRSRRKCTADVTESMDMSFLEGHPSENQAISYASVRSQSYRILLVQDSLIERN